MPSEPEESTAFSVIFIFPLHLHRPCCCAVRRPKTSGAWNHVKGYMSRPKTEVCLLHSMIVFCHLISEEWMILLLIQAQNNSSLLCDSFYSDGLITKVAAPPVLPQCWPGIWQNIRILSLPVNEQTFTPQHLIGDGVDEWLIATTPLIERD